jgi:hypothetical protein
LAENRWKELVGVTGTVVTGGGVTGDGVSGSELPPPEPPPHPVSTMVADNNACASNDFVNIILFFIKVVF